MRTGTFESIVVEADAGVVTVTMNRPHVKNAADAAMWTELRETWTQISLDPSARVVVMTGAGDAFCSGADVSAMGADGAPERHQLQAMHEIHLTAQALHSLTVPVIAKVNGVAAGAGCNLALACDLIVASDTARFSEIFHRRGLSVDFGGTWVLPRLVGLHKAKELAFFAEVIDAAEAERLGIVNRVVPSDQLDATVDDWAGRLVKAPPLALAMTKRMLNAGVTADLTAQLDMEGLAQTVNFATSDTREAVQAFRDKREPEFRGR